MAKNKTSETVASVTEFINAVTDATKRADSHQLIKLLEEQTGHPAKMWGLSIVGFGSYHYKYESGHEGDAPLVGFSPRSSAITLYLYCPEERKGELLQQLGKHKAGKGCIYIKKLSDVNVDVLKEMISESIKYIRSKYPNN
jgi:hypothetical protein